MRSILNSSPVQPALQRAEAVYQELIERERERYPDAQT